MSKMKKSKIFLWRLRINFFLKRILERHTDFYLGIVGFNLARKAWPGNRVTSMRSKIVIEGYPRSANSFAIQAFMASQNCESFQIGNHTHSPANIIRGVQLKIPVLLLIREPKDAILGSVVYESIRYGEIAKGLEKKQIKIHARRYIDFYRVLIPYLDEIVVAQFTDVTSDFGKVIENINQQYGSQFLPFMHSDENVKKIFEKSAQHLSPSKVRSDLKATFQNYWNGLEKDGVVRECNVIYNKLVSRS